MRIYPQIYPQNLYFYFPIIEICALLCFKLLWTPLHLFLTGAFTFQFATLSFVSF